MRFVVLAILAGAMLAFPAADARAGDLAQARKLFAEGIRLYQGGDWEGARRLFREADAEHHAAAIVYNIGLAEEKLGHPQSAVDAYEAYLAESGDRGDLSAAAATALAQVRARSTKLRVDTRPPGARVFVDGTPLTELAPASLLVAAGHHVVVVQGEGWREEREVEVRGAGDVAAVVFDAPAAPVRPSTPEPAPSSPPQERVVPAPVATSPSGPDGFVWSAAFAMLPMFMLGATTPNVTNSGSAASFLAGGIVDLGWAISERFEFVARGFAGVGSDASPSYGYLGGPAVSFHVVPRLWIGGTFIGGRIETASRGARYGTDLVFGTMLEASLVLLEKSSGEWFASVQPSVLIAKREDNTTLFLPLAFGYRGF